MMKTNYLLEIIPIYKTSAKKNHCKDSLSVAIISFEMIQNFYAIQGISIFWNLKKNNLTSLNA